MAEINFFHYRKSEGILNALHPGIKLVSFFLLSILTFSSGILPLSLISIFVLILFILFFMKSKAVHVSGFMKTLSGFLVFLLLISSGRWLAEGGREGLSAGLFYSWKLLILMLCGHLLTSTTDTSEIHGAVHMILNPLPLVPAGRIAAMVSLTISFIPLIFDQYTECREAYDSRLGSSSANPLRKIFYIAYPLMLNTVFRAEEVADAMESRCYNDNPTIPDMRIRNCDKVAILFMMLFFPLIIYLNYV